MTRVRPTFALLPLLTFSMFAGCSTSHTRQESWTPAEQLSYAEERILAQRLIKQRLIQADPVERQIEAYLKHDPRVVSARFSIALPEFGTYSPTPEHFPFVVVVTTHQAMSQDDALTLLGQACASAGYRVAHWDKSSIVMDKDTWGIRWGTLIPLSAENPDLSALHSTEEKSK